jgi:tetratricopeptide (TPR) repeat protein
MPIEPSIHPFPGLRPFEADEQDLFFGREGQSEEILSRLRRHRFVAVVGASGSGKSSLVRAGLLPFLHGGFLASAGSHWRVAIFRPGGDPIKNLAAALDDPAVLGRPAENADAAAQSTMLLEVSLRRSGLGLIEAIQLARRPEDEQVLIVVDQFEELFRFAGAAHRAGRDEDAAAFVKLLLEASQQRELPIYVVLTMRSDYIGDCARYRGLAEAVTTALYLIPRMTRDQRRSAIVEPVRVGGGTIAPRLVVRLLNDVGDDPDQLPILQHALMRTWDYWKAHGGNERSIDVEDYLAIGSMVDALSQHADEAYDGLADDHDRAIARRVFQALSEKGPDNREARRPTTVAKLAQVADASFADIVRVIDAFRAPGRSFLVPAQDVVLAPDSVIDISHESLIRGWRRMRKWVEEEAESARVYRRLAETASLHAQGTAGLLHDPDLEHVLRWRAKERPNSGWGHRYYAGFEQAMAFVEQSRLAREAERRQRQSTRRRVRLASSAATAAIAIVAVIALWQWREAKSESNRAISESDRAQLALKTADTERDRAQLALKTADTERDRAQLALKTADMERDHAQQGLKVATQLASSLVFGMGQEFRLHGLGQQARQLFDQAILSFDQVIKIEPTAAAYNGRGMAYRYKGDLVHAIADFNQAIALDPKYAHAYNNRGLSYEAKGDLDHAIADYDQTITLDPKYFLAYNNRGLSYEAKGDLDHAIADFDQAIALNPKYPLAYNNRGTAYRAKGDLDRAIADYDQAIALDPKYANAYTSRGNAYYDGKDYDHALADHDQAIAIDPKYAVAYNNRGLSYEAKGDLDHAIADFDQAIALNPKYAQAYNSRGNAYTANGDLDRAIAEYDQAIMLDPKLWQVYVNRAVAYIYAGSLSKALTDLERSSELNPKYLYTAIWFDIANKRGNLTSRLAQAVTQIDMTKWPAPVIQLYLGQLSRADLLAAADDPNPHTKKGQVCEANFYAGELELQQGAKEEATRLFRLAAADCPKSFRERVAAEAELKALGEGH